MKVCIGRMWIRHLYKYNKQFLQPLPPPVDIAKYIFKPLISSKDTKPISKPPSPVDIVKYIYI